MYSVNLLPENYLKNAKYQAIKNRLIYSGILLLAILFLVYRTMIALGNQRYDQYNAMAQDNLSLVRLITEMKDPNTPDADEGKIEAIISSISESGEDFSQLLVRIANSSPDDVAISYFSMGQEDPNVVCIVYASAASYDTVSEWIQNLSEIDSLGEITSSYISTDQESNSGRVTFELRIPIL